jgi:hypothetical protein
MLMQRLGLPYFEEKKEPTYDFTIYAALLITVTY